MFSIIGRYAAGVPVIGSSIGGIPEIIENGRTGFLFNQGNKNELIEAIKKAEQLSLSEYQAISHNALLFANQHFNKVNYYPRLWKFYSQFLNNKQEK